ncbi:MAG: metal-dependent hydrolase [Thermoplasmata archaeon]|nr:metal-dependent hydrolase [Thermoplasmata archaeon]
MDPFSHYMVAYATGRKADIGINKMRAMTLAAVIPDIDGFSIIFGLEAFKDFHGGPVHSILIGVIMALIITLGFYLFTKENVIIWSFLGVTYHLLLDIPNTLGYKLAEDGLFYLWPFSDSRIALQNVVPDPVIWQIVIVSIIFFSSLAYFLLGVRKGEYAWRIWFDERNLFKGKKEKPT